MVKLNPTQNRLPFKVLCIVILATVLSLLPIAHAQVAHPLVQLIGRVSAYQNLDLFMSEKARLLPILHGDEYKAVTIANGVMNAEAEERLSEALDEIRRNDPERFDRTFERYGLALQPN